MVFGGYVACIAYVFFLIYLVGPAIKRISNLETSRKTIHTMLFFVWVLIDIFFKNTIHQVILPIIFIVLNTLSYKFKLYRSVERENENDLGTIYFAVAITIILGLAFLYPALYLPSGVAVVCLTFGDGFAALLGFNFKSRKIKDNKSILGFAACFLFSLLALLAFCRIWNVPIGFGSILVISAFAAIFELAGKGLDNFSVSIGTFLISYCLIVNDSQSMVAGLMIAAVIFCIVFLSKAIDYFGSVLAMVIVFSFAYFGATAAIVYLLLAYFIIFAVSFFKKSHTAKKERASRSFVQILINGVCGTLFVVVYGITGIDDYLILSMIAIGGCFVDSISSDVGALSRGNVYDIIRGRKTEKGLSGGVSLLGTAASLVACLLIGGYIFFFVRAEFGIALAAAVMCMVQTVIDSILGSAVQAKYTCAVCGAAIEEKTHCHVPAIKYTGVRWIDNNTVNILSSIVVCVISYLIIVAV